MKETIKNKLHYLIEEKDLKEDTYKYIYKFKLRTLILLSISGLSYFTYSVHKLIFADPFSVPLLLKVFVGVGAIVIFPIILMFIVGFIMSLFEERNLIKEYIYDLSLEEEIDKEFGSVENLISIYKELKKLDLGFSDENFYKMMNSSEFIDKKNIKISNIREKKLNKLDERIKKLRNEKEAVYFNSNNKVKETINNIEYKGVDISMDLSELKERVVTGGLR